MVRHIVARHFILLTLDKLSQFLFCHNVAIILLYNKGMFKFILNVKGKFKREDIFSFEEACNIIGFTKIYNYTKPFTIIKDDKALNIKRV